MKFVFAPDSFKGSVSAERVTEILEARALARFPGARTVCLPMADGGEGTMSALKRVLGGEMITRAVRDPLGRIIDAQYARLKNGDCVIEMARASGLTLLKPNERDPMRASSYGFGELIASALDSGAKRLIICIGGSATNDGGMGMLIALGARFYDARGRALTGEGAQLEYVNDIDISGLNARVQGVKLTVLSDVTNPMLGEHGATRVYGPQKGADERALDALERGMAAYARAFRERLGLDISDFPGAGAAGGCGAALAGVMRAEIKSGVDEVLNLADFDAHISGATLAITGEGRVDGQTARYGKVPSGVLKRCARAGVPCAIIAGSMGDGASELYKQGDAIIFPITDKPMPLESAMLNAEKLIEATADRIYWAFHAGLDARRG